MKRGADPGGRPADEDRLEALRARGLYDQTFEVELKTAPGMLEVRPLVDDGTPDWTTRVEDGLGLRQGACVGVVSEDPLLAAAAAVRLAVSIADRGQRIVLVDGSVQAPTIAKALPDDGDEGLVDSVLFGVSTAVTARRTLAPGVSLMTTGSSPVSAGEVFRSENLRATFRSFAPDVVVVVALPSQHAADVAAVVTTLVAVGRSEAELERLAQTGHGARPPRVVGLLATRPLPVVPGGLRPEPADREERAPETDAAPQAQVGPAPAPVPEVAEVAPMPAGEEAGVAKVEPTPAAEPARGAAVRGERQRVRTALRETRPVPRPRSRRGPVTVVFLAVAALAVFGIWRLGLPGREPVPPAHVSVESPTRAAAPGTTAVAPPAGTGTAVLPSAGAGGPGAPTPSETQEPAAIREPVSSQTTEPAPREPAQAPRLDGPGGRYVLYLTSHASDAPAEVDVAELERRNVAAAIVAMEVPGKGVRYRVRVAGGYPTLDAARGALAEVRKLGYEGAWIERSPVSQ